MGTHPIFESDFDCLTDNKSYIMDETAAYCVLFNVGKEDPAVSYLGRGSHFTSGPSLSGIMTKQTSRF